MLRLIRNNAFVLMLLLAFVVSELLVSAWDPVSRYVVFSKNDYQRTVDASPDGEWPKVIFGNSSVVAAYNEKESEAEYVNLGMNYGKITDLEAMLRKNMIHIGEELVIGLNLFTFMDELPTDPSYGWHRHWYEPYLYFYRDQLSTAATKYGIPYLKGEAITVNRTKLYAKELYYGQLKPAELQKKIDDYKSIYYVKTIDDFRDNLAAMDKVIAYAAESGIRVRVLWMPWNSGKLPNPDYVDDIKAQVKQKLAAAGIPFTDWTDKFQQEHFHDLGHLNVEQGRPLFTEEFDRWAFES